MSPRAFLAMAFAAVIGTAADGTLPHDAGRSEAKTVTVRRQRCFCVV
jgi:hypothetical protein